MITRCKHMDNCYRMSCYSDRSVHVALWEHKIRVPSTDSGDKGGFLEEATHRMLSINVSRASSREQKPLYARASWGGDS